MCKRWPVIKQVYLAHHVSVDVGGNGAAVAGGEYVDRGLTASRMLRPRRDMRKIWSGIRVHLKHLLITQQLLVSTMGHLQLR